MAEKHYANHPFISNYPPLKAWLDKHDAFCMWQRAMQDTPRDADSDWYPSAYIECWMVNNRPVIILVHSRKMGWDIFTSMNTAKIDDTLADANKRVGLVKGCKVCGSEGEPQRENGGVLKCTNCGAQIS